MMQRLSATTLRTRLLVLVGVPLLLLLLTETVISYLVGMHSANQVFDSWLLDSAHSIAQEIRDEGDGISFIAAEDAVEMFEWDEVDDTYFHIAHVDGRTVAGDLARPARIDIASLRQGPVYRDIRLGDQQGRTVTILRTTGRGNEFVVQVAETLNKRQNMTTEVMSLIALKKTVLLVGAMIAIGVSVRRGLAPLHRLADLLATRSPRDFTPVSVGDAPREVSALVDNTNSLLARIEHMLSAHENFIGNIAHQVRTPIAGIKLQSQLAEREQDPAAVRRALQQIEHAADHMAHVNSQLLKLARAEIALDRGAGATPADLIGIARVCTEELAPLADERGVSVTVDAADDHFRLEGDPALLREMLTNLVHNAIVYGKPRGHVRIGLERVDGGTRIVVEDDGPGIDAAHRDRIFDHFYRPPDSPGDGSGLGLPIVREIARAHGGDVRLESHGHGAGTRFSVLLPGSGEMASRAAA